jgi:SAM-dependent MidA family methyltransferase
MADQMKDALDQTSSYQELDRLIAETIRERGKITFARFMDMALYHPEWGYYMRPDTRIGPRGDFYTSPHVHPLFGMAIGEQLAQMWDLLGHPHPFTVVESGAGQGLLVRDILDGLARRHPACLDSTRYIIIERSPHLIHQQRMELAESPLSPASILWLDGLDQLPDHGQLSGCILSNEFVDALPVHRIRRRASRIKEIYVGYEKGYTEKLDDPSTPLLVSYFADLNIELEEGQEAEVNLAALSWLDEMARALDRGFILTIDYGYESPELYGPRFPRGTLMCYRQHRATENPYAYVGQQDLTSHVNFTSLMRKGRELGLQTTGFTHQMKFLIALGILQMAQEWNGGVGAEQAKAKLAARQLIMPGGMGDMFKVLVHHKGVGAPQLKGLSPPW